MMRVYQARGFNPAQMRRFGQPDYHDHHLASSEVLRMAVEGLAPLPGRKTIIFISQWAGWLDGARGEASNRADRGNVELHRVNPVIPFTRVSNRILHNEEAARLKTRIDPILRRIRGYATGYYLIGFRPARAPIPGATSQLTNVKVTVRRGGLMVHSRNGYYTPAQTRALALPAERLLEFPQPADLALGGRIRMQMIPLLTATGKDPKSGLRRPILRTVAAIDPSTLHFEDLGNGFRKASLEIAVLARGQGNQVLRKSGTCTMTVSAGELAESPCGDCCADWS